MGEKKGRQTTDGSQRIARKARPCAVHPPLPLSLPCCIVDAMQPQLERIDPAAALPGAEVRLVGHGFRPPSTQIPEVHFAGMPGSVVISSPESIVARVPEGALTGPVQISWMDDLATIRSNDLPAEIGVSIAENLHPVCNPAIDAEGNILVTFSGSRGQKTPVSLYKIDANYSVKAHSSSIMNPSGLAFDRSGTLFVSSRHDGTVYRVAANGTAAVWAESLGIATGLAFDTDENLYVGDRSGTIFKIDRDRTTFVFATLEPSVAAYHLAFGPDRYLYVAGPTTSSYDNVWRISPSGEVEVFYRGLGRPQGLAFDLEGNLYLAASWRGHRGIVRITPDRKANLAIAGNGLVGLAFARGPAIIVATTNSLFHLDWKTPGLPLLPSR